MGISTFNRVPQVTSGATYLRNRLIGLGMGASLATVDAVLLAVAAVSGFAVWSVFNPAVGVFHPTMGLAVAGCLLGLAFFGLYPSIGLTAVEQIRRCSYGITFVYLLLTASMFFIKEWWGDSRGGFFLSWLLSLLLVPLGRSVVREVFCEQHWWGIPVIVLGAGETARSVIRNLAANRSLGYRPVACLDDDPNTHGTCEGVPVVGRLLEASYFAQVYQSPCAIFAIPNMPRIALVHHLRRWSLTFRTVLVIPDLFGVASLATESRDLGGIVGLEITHNLLKRRNRWLKRIMDVTVSSAALVFAAPLVALATLWIRAVSPGSPFYWQEREGEGQEPIRILKLRTMYPHADEMLEKHLDANPAAREEWTQFCKLKNDPRILPGIGHLLRKTSLDELPQLWNVLKGEMSLVGPRPFPEYHNELFDYEFRSLRTQVTPGLTGLWQVSARSNGDLTVQANLDSYYIRNWSIWLDLYILARTAVIVLTQHGAC